MQSGSRSVTAQSCQEVLLLPGPPRAQDHTSPWDRLPRAHAGCLVVARFTQSLRHICSPHVFAASTAAWPSFTVNPGQGPSKPSPFTPCCCTPGQFWDISVTRVSSPRPSVVSPTSSPSRPLAECSQWNRGSLLPNHSFAFCNFSYRKSGVF